METKPLLVAAVPVPGVAAPMATALAVPVDMLQNLLGAEEYVGVRPPSHPIRCVRRFRH